MKPKQQPTLQYVWFEKMIVNYFLLLSAACLFITPELIKEPMKRTNLLIYNMIAKIDAEKEIRMKKIWVVS